LKKQGLDRVAPSFITDIAEIEPNSLTREQNLREKAKTTSGGLTRLTANVLSLADIHRNLQKIVDLTYQLTKSSIPGGFSAGKTSALILESNIGALQPLLSSLSKELGLHIKSLRKNESTLSSSLKSEIDSVLELPLWAGIGEMKKAFISEGNQKGLNLIEILDKTPLGEIPSKSEKIDGLLAEASSFKKR
jgi:hypothetical protein